MKRIKGFTFLCVLTFLSVILIGCGGDSSSPEAPKFSVISGVVEDGPIENARVSLRDKDNNSLVESSTLTDSKGAFSLQVPVGMDLVGLSVVAVGGIDRATRIDFTGMEMRSPLALFKGDVTKIVVSPLTTLFAELQDQNISFENAEGLLRNWLALSPEFNLLAEPHTNLDLLRRTLLLTQIAREVKSRTPTANPFVAIAENVVKQVPLFATQTTCNIDTLKALNLTPDAQTRISEMQTLLSEALTIEGAAAILKQKELMDLFSASIKIILNDESAFTELQNNSIYKENLKLLAKVTLNAASSDVIILGGPISQRITRYVLFTYQLRTSVIWTDSANFEIKLASIEKDPLIAELARNGFIDTKYRLLAPLGDDNHQRQIYYFNSELSPYFQAEQLIGQVFDDAINDAVLLKIIEGKANAGLIDEARLIIATQIVSSAAKAEAYKSLAEALIDSRREEEAIFALDNAYDFYKKTIDLKIPTNVVVNDFTNLRKLADDYNNVGVFSRATYILEYIKYIASEIYKLPAESKKANYYGYVITSIKMFADTYLEEGDLAEASKMVDEMYGYSMDMKDMGSDFLFAYNLIECAKRYASLGNLNKVEEIYFNPVTVKAPWNSIAELVESLYRVGKEEEAYNLAVTIPKTNAASSKAYKLVATYEALQGSLDDAFAIVNNQEYLSSDAERIELLTYYNATTPYIGKSLIEAGDYTAARLALAKAAVILDGMTESNNLLRISSGYVKVAELYALMGDKVQAENLLQRAQEKIAADPYQITAMADIALGYQNLGQSAAALNLLDNAQNLADVDPTAFRANTTLNLGEEEYATQLYEILIKSYKAVGDKDRVLRATRSFQSWAKKIHPTGTVNDKLAIKECVYLLRAVLYLDQAGYHLEAVDVLNSARELTVGRVENNITVYDIVILKDRLANYLNVITTYAEVHEYEKALELALSLEYTAERNQAIQTLANAYINRDDFPDTWVASIDSDGDGKPDFFNPLASAEEIAASGLIMDDDSDGDGIPDSEDFRPFFDDRL